MLSYAPGWVEDFGGGRGVSYGSLYNYDSRVPLIFYGGPFRSRTYEEAGGERSMWRPPWRAWRAWRIPPSSIGRVLGEAFQ